MIGVMITNAQVRPPTLPLFLKMNQAMDIGIKIPDKHRANNSPPNFIQKSPGWLTLYPTKPITPFK